MSHAKKLDFPFNDVVREATAAINRGMTVYQKFTCAKCGSRQTMTEPNVFFQFGKCERCGFETDLVMLGCNYAAVVSLIPITGP